MSSNLANTLYQRPDIAQEVGWLVMYTTNLEAFLAPVIGAILGCTDVTAEGITKNIDNISAKLSIVEAVATARKDIEPKARVVLGVMPAITAAIALRNRLAHCLYGINMADEVSILTNVITNRRGKPGHEVLDAKKIHAVVDALRDALMKLEVGGLAPTPFVHTKALALASQEKRAQANQKQGKHPRARKAPSGRNPP